MQSTLSECFVRGQVVEFNYPVTNQADAKLKYQRRRVSIRKIRDLEVEQLSEKTLRQNPELRRARYLIFGVDLDIMEPRQFYLDSMVGVITNPGPFYRVGVYNPSEPWSAPHFVGSAFDDDEETAMQSFVEEVKQCVATRGSNEQVGVYLWQ